MILLVRQVHNTRPNSDDSVRALVVTYVYVYAQKFCENFWAHFKGSENR